MRLQEPKHAQEEAEDKDGRILRGEEYNFVVLIIKIVYEVYGSLSQPVYELVLGCTHRAGNKAIYMHMSKHNDYTKSIVICDIITLTYITICTHTHTLTHTHTHTHTLTSLFGKATIITTRTILLASSTTVHQGNFFLNPQVRGSTKWWGQRGF